LSNSHGELYDETVASSPNVVDAQRIALHAERLEAVTQRVRGRVATITRRPVVVRKTIEVDVMHEELVVEYAPGDGTPMLEAGGEAIVVLLRAEEVEIVKHARVVEEVHISKRDVQTSQRYAGSVRHETIDVLPPERVE